MGTVKILLTRDSLKMNNDGKEVDVKLESKNGKVTTTKKPADKKPSTKKKTTKKSYTKKKVGK